MPKALKGVLTPTWPCKCQKPALSLLWKKFAISIAGPAHPRKQGESCGWGWITCWSCCEYWPYGIAQLNQCTPSNSWESWGGPAPPAPALTRSEDCTVEAMRTECQQSLMDPLEQSHQTPMCITLAWLQACCSSTSLCEIYC